MPNEEHEDKNNYDSLLDYIYKDKWPTISKFMSESLEHFMGEKRIGVFGHYLEEGNGWSKMEYLAKELASQGYSVLTGKSIFKCIKGVVVEFPFFLAHIAQFIIETRILSKWLVRQVPKAIFLLGKLKTTASYEEEEAADNNIQSYGIAILDIPNNVNFCKMLKISSMSLQYEYLTCTGKLGDCLINKANFCPFINKGTPIGTIDLYLSHNHMNLLSTSKIESVIPILNYIKFLN